MVETGLVGVPGWCSSSETVVKFDFNPGNVGSSPTIQVDYSTLSIRPLDLTEQIYIFAMVQVRKS